MLKHHPKLKKLWKKAPKIGKGSIVSLDMRSKKSKEFLKEFSRTLDMGTLTNNQLEDLLIIANKDVE